MNANGTQPSIPPSSGGGGGASVDGSNITSPSTWRANLSVPSVAEETERLVAMAGGVRFDGVTTGQRASAWVPGLNIGRDEFSLSVEARIPASAPAAGVCLAAISSSSSTTAARSLLVWLTASGYLEVSLYGSSTGGTVMYRWISTSDFTSLYGSSVVTITLVRSSTTLTVYANDTDITSLGSSSSGGGAGAPAAWDESLVGQYLHLSCTGLVYVDRIVRAVLRNYAMTQAQVTSFWNDGILANERWPEIYGLNAILNQEGDANFTGSATNWAISGGFTTVAISGGTLHCVDDGSGGMVALGPTYMTQLTPGVLHRITFTVANWSGGGSLDVGLYVSNGGSSLVAIGTITANGTYTYDFTPTVGVAWLGFKNTAGSDHDFNLSAISVSRVLAANGSFETAGSPIASWTKSESGSSTVVRNTSAQRSGAACLELSVVSTAAVSVSQAVTVPGRKYRAVFYAKASTGTPSIAIGGSTAASQAVQALTTTMTRYSVDFESNGTSVVISMYSGSTGTYSLYVDDFELIELGALVDLSPAGLDQMSLLWRNSNPFTGDAYISGLTQIADGRYQGIVHGWNRSFVDSGSLGRVSRETGAQALGGIHLPGTSGQRLSITNGPSIGTDAFWIRMQFCVPATVPAADKGLWCISGSATPGVAANAFLAKVDTNGDLLIVLNGSSGTDLRTATLVDFVPKYGGRTIDLWVNRGASGALALYVNQYRVRYVETISGTPPTWSGSVSSTYVHWAAYSATVVWVGTVHRAQIGRGTLTDLIVRQAYNAGIGTGTGAAASTPISRGGVFGSSDGIVIDTDLTAGAGRLYYDIAAGNYPAQSNVGDEVHALLARNQVLQFTNTDKRYSGASPNGSTGITSYGDALTLSGTATSSAADANQPQCLNEATAATTGTNATVYSGAIHYTGRNPRFAALIRMVDITVVRIWCGFQSGSAATGFNNDTPTSLSVAAFRFSTVTSDTNWMCTTCGGSAGTYTDSGVAVSAAAPILLEAEIISGQRVNFWINGKLISPANTTNLPSASASLRWQLYIEARENVSKSVKFINVDINS